VLFRSVVPLNLVNSKFFVNKPKNNLTAANGSVIRSFGRISLTLNIGDNLFQWYFVVASVSHCIIGADFLAHYDLLVDCRNKCIRPNHNSSPSIIPLNHTNDNSCLQVSNKKTHKRSYIFFNSGKLKKVYTKKTLADLDSSEITSDRVNHSVNLVSTNEVLASNSSDVSIDLATELKIDLDKITNNKVFVDRLLTTFPNVFNQFTNLEGSGCVAHNIITNGLPVHSRVRCLPPDKLEAAKEIFRDLESRKIIRRSSSHWSSALLMKKKSNGDWRCCGDYRRLNAITLKDEYPLPLIKDVTTRLADAKFFSKIDLIQAYYQIPMSEEDICKTAVTTPFGLFEFIRMPFGLKNAAASFQRAMDQLFRNLKHVVVYLDDILVGSKDISDHEKHLIEVLEVLDKQNLKINLKKCSFFTRSVDFLGHTISENSLNPIRSKIEYILDLQPPNNVREIRRICGMINFYHQFIKDCSLLLSPFTESIKGKKSSIKSLGMKI